MQCPICFEPVVDPVAHPCKHVVCRSCDSKHKSHGGTVCPLCRGPVARFEMTPAARLGIAFLIIITIGMVGMNGAQVAIVLASLGSGIVSASSNSVAYCVSSVVGFVSGTISFIGTSRWAVAFVVFCIVRAWVAYRILNRRYNIIALTGMEACVVCLMLSHSQAFVDERLRASAEHWNDFNVGAFSIYFVLDQIGFVLCCAYE